jgi:uracil-DNA glycosylase family protein
MACTVLDRRASVQKTSTTARQPNAKAAGAKPAVESTESFIPEVRTIANLRKAAAGCHGCPLYLRATQTVFGEGPQTARIVAVGEQPGDYEDRKGRPFVGPAGRVLDKALAQAGIDRGTVYVTNAVKHFTFEERGKARIHKKPRQSDVKACNPWLRAELEAIRPDVLLLMGSTAAQAVLGPQFRITRERGKPLASDLAPVVMATAHPSSVLRALDDAARHEAYRLLVSDLEVAARELRKRAER